MLGGEVGRRERGGKKGGKEERGKEKNRLGAGGREKRKDYEVGQGKNGLNQGVR